MEAALRDPAAWRGTSPTGADTGAVLLTAEEPPADGQIWVRPDAELEVVQTVAPLERQLDRYGIYAIDGDSLLTITAAGLGGEQADHEPVLDWFAPAQYDDYRTNGEKLAAPSYEEMTGGVRFGTDSVSVSPDAHNRTVTPDYEVKILDEDKTRDQPLGKLASPLDLVDRHACARRRKARPPGPHRDIHPLHDPVVQLDHRRRRHRRRHRRHRHLPRGARRPAHDRRRRPDRARGAARRAHPSRPGARMSDEITFLPWIRRGLAQAVENADPLNGGLPRGGALEAYVDLERRHIRKTLSMRGPEAVAGLSAAQVLRSEPRPDSTDVEPNYFPLVELAAPDLPWMFTPARAEDGQGKLRPWLVLVVVREQEGVRIETRSGTSLPVLRIESPAVPAGELPDLAESWAWAHVHSLVEPDGDRGRGHGPHRRGRTRGCSARAASFPTAPGSPASCPPSTAASRAASAGRSRTATSCSRPGTTKRSATRSSCPSTTTGASRPGRRATSRRSAGA